MWLAGITASGSEAEINSQLQIASRFISFQK